MKGVINVKYENNKAVDVKIAYIGGGSRGWAWGLMSDLANTEDMSGSVYLYDIDSEAATDNEIIGNRVKNYFDCASEWKYVAVKTIDDALKNADFVIISILPGTFEEMASDVHTPEKYGIYQSVGDTSGPGGIIRAMRTVPMYEEFALAIKEHCPNAWVINYTNPMTLCTKTLYRVFPEIKAFGCCHEVFGTQKLLSLALEKVLGIKDVSREDIKVNPVAVNHFTWITKAKYKNIDLFPVYKKFTDMYHKEGYGEHIDQNWMNASFLSKEKVKMDLFRRYGYIAAAGDRHLAEFCPGKWYLADPETVKSWGFGLTTVDYRKEDLKKRLKRSKDLKNGEDKFRFNGTGEEGVLQMRALLGLSEFVTNVNIPNMGQIPNLPIGAVVETNAVFTSDTVAPVFAGEVPSEIFPLVSRICGEQEELNTAIAERDVNRIFNVFANDPLTTCTYDEAKALFKEMVENTKEYLTMYSFEW